MNIEKTQTCNKIKLWLWDCKANHINLLRMTTVSAKYHKQLSSQAILWSFVLWTCTLDFFFNLCLLLYFRWNPEKTGTGCCWIKFWTLLKKEWLKTRCMDLNVFQTWDYVFKLKADFDLVNNYLLFNSHLTSGLIKITRLFTFVRLDVLIWCIKLMTL